MPEIMRFLDEFLQNVRKHNDIYKVQFIDTNSPIEGHNKHATVTEHIKRAMNKILDLVLRIFYRLSLTMESDTDYFSLSFY